MTMKKLLLAGVAVAAMAALPNLAQAASKAGAHAASARVPGTSAPPSTYVVYDEYGRYAGADPDPNIRFQLHREAEALQGF
jgi:hypothetical protein